MLYGFPNINSWSEESCNGGNKGFVCGYPCGEKWTDGAGAKPMPLFEERPNLLDQSFTLRHVRVDLAGAPCIPDVAASALLAADGKGEFVCIVGDNPHAADKHEYPGGVGLRVKRVPELLHEIVARRAQESVDARAAEPLRDAPIHAAREEIVIRCRVHAKDRDGEAGQALGHQGRRARKRV